MKNVSREYRAILAALINSEQVADRERAQAECLYYGLDYDAERRRILAKMIEDGKALMERQETGESRTQSGYAPTRRAEYTKGET